MNKKFIAFIGGAVIVGICAILTFAYFSKAESESAKISVIASFYPLAYFAEKIAGEYATVTNVTPSGAEPHDFEPTLRDIVKINKANIFIYNGNGFDEWAEKIAPDLKKNGVTVMRASDYVTPLPMEEKKTSDPHFWLDPTIVANNIVTEIERILATVDPAHAENYKKNAAAHSAELALLHDEYTKGLFACKTRDLVTSHNAFNYLAKRYNLTNLYISGLSPDEEPPPQSMAEIVKKAREKNVTHIFFETLVSSKLSETIAKEIGAQTLVLNPIEGLSRDEIANGKDYTSVMRDNLKNIRIALSCQ